MIGRIEFGVLVETGDISIDDVPEHKRASWFPVEGSMPETAVASASYEIRDAWGYALAALAAWAN